MLRLALALALALALPLPLLLLAAPAAAQDVYSQGVQSTLGTSAVSVSADPQLSDGRLVLRIAAQNKGTGAVAFGPGNVQVTLAGKPVALVPLATLISDVRAAAGLEQVERVADAPAPSIGTNNSGQKEVGGYTGGMGMAPAPVRSKRAAKLKPEELAAVEAQVAGLKAGILQDQQVAPGGVAAGQLVTEKLKLKGKDRVVAVTVTVGGDSHSFRFEAPAS